MFNKNQRGLCKGKSKLHNLNDLICAARELKQKRRYDKSTTAAIVFFDLTKAYDMVDRAILIEKLLNYNIPVNIVLIKKYARKFTLKYEGQEIKTQRGLMQGSVLSPLLFNLYINDLKWNQEFGQILSWDYADDIAWVWESANQARQAIEIVNKWSLENKIIINPQKSEIMRILLKRSKCIGISNCINISEVDNYCYLGITITQSLSLDDHESKIREIELFLNRRIGILKPSILMTKSRLMLFDSILRAKISYAWAIIWTHNKKYIEKWESMLYKLIKRMF